AGNHGTQGWTDRRALVLRTALNERHALPLVLELREVAPAAVLALPLAGRHARQRSNRDSVRIRARRHRGGGLGNKRAAAPDVVLGYRVTEVVRDVDAVAV